MNTNEKIAKWLKLESYQTLNGFGQPIYLYKRNNVTITDLDFLHNRNQQKWIEDKLIELGYGIASQWFFLSEMWNIEIYPDKSDGIRIDIVNKSKDLAFIQAVEQLIDKV